MPTARGGAAAPEPPRGSAGSGSAESINVKQFVARAVAAGYDAHVSGASSGDGAIEATLITQEWQITHHKRSLGKRLAQSTAYGLAVMKHVFKRDRKGGRMAKNHHRQ